MQHPAELKRPNRPPFLMFVLFSLVLVWPPQASSSDQWEEDIQAFETQDRQSPPEPGQILFLGSSSIRLWDLDHYFPGLDAINRGFGGSEIEDSLVYADRIVIPYRPRAIVFYAGDNDIAAGKTPQQVFQDFVSFDNKIHRKLPGTRLIFISIKPSLDRWGLFDQMKEANRLIQGYAEAHEHVAYLDIGTPMLGRDGKPKPELFVEDGLHLNDQGYQLWSRLLKELFARLGVFPAK